ncbi:MAG: hypothetical protein L6R37_002897 [Teloschistes peruensis]|nr:MAG: hypothetical protein L6R37_002897 [Teloschistes peruensis]
MFYADHAWADLDVEASAEAWVLKDAGLEVEYPYHLQDQSINEESGKPVKKLPEELSLSSTSTSSDLYSQLAASSKTSIHRLRITKGSDGSLVPNIASVSISDTGLRDGSSIYVKDLGKIPTHSLE